MIRFAYGFDARSRLFGDEREPSDYVMPYSTCTVIRCGDAGAIPQPYEPANNPLPRVDTRDITRPRVKAREIRSAS